jgi:hypothetical protein
MFGNMRLALSPGSQKKIAEPTLPEPVVLVFYPTIEVVNAMRATDVGVFLRGVVGLVVSGVD